MTNQRPHWLMIFLISGLACTPARCAESTSAEPTNAFCPVMPEMESLPEITLCYRGVEVRFCCTGCRREFLANPEKYLASLPHIPQPGMMEKSAAFFNAHSDLLLIGSCFVGLVWLRLSRNRWAAECADKPNSFKSLATRPVSPTIPLLLLLVFAGYEINALDSALYYRLLEEDIHFATHNDYGSPPIPSPPQHERRLAGTYYRGNDERSPLLFNGGNYRTATFHVSLVDSAGQQIEYDQRLDEGPVYLRLQIDRTPYTPDFLYSDRFMHAIFLTRESSTSLGRNAPVVDRVSLTELETMWQWDARYPIAKSTEADTQLEGVVYVCEEKYHQPHRFADEKTIAGARFHYGMPYRFVVRDGKVAPESELSMGSLYRTRKFPLHEVPLDQWFSEAPIPVLPEENTKDPSLLGIDDYLSHEH